MVGKSVGALARQALKSLHAPSMTGLQAAYLADSYLGQIADQSGDNTEKTLALTATRAMGGLKLWCGQVAVGQVALAALAAGVAGEPVTRVLATVGLDAMFAPADWTMEEQAHVGRLFTTVLGTTSNDRAVKDAVRAIVKVSSELSEPLQQIRVLERLLQRQSQPTAESIIECGPFA